MGGGRQGREGKGRRSSWSARTYGAEYYGTRHRIPKAQGSHQTNKWYYFHRSSYHDPPALPLAVAAIFKHRAPGKACAVHVDTVDPSRPKATCI